VLRLVWTPEALADLQTTIDYIAERNVSAAEKLQALIEHTAEQLPLHPFLYRPGRVPRTREAVVHPNHILVYRVGIDVIDVLAVLHARQRYP
jgi:addiction module RelE/StbE family toxin